jgi:hypothetical protein
LGKIPELVIHRREGAMSLTLELVRSPKGREVDKDAERTAAVSIIFFSAETEK